MTGPLLALQNVSKSFRRDGARFAALSDVTLDIDAGETLALAGPSGSGKSTLARIVMRLLEPDAGQVMLAGADMLGLAGAALRAKRSQWQMVFQDTYAAFNPRATVGKVLTDPLRIHSIVARRERPAALAELLGRVGLDPALAARRIHEISGGQRQRIAIARAIATRPSLVVLDEAVSALDVSTRADILALLWRLQRDDGIAYLFVTHDLAVARSFAHRVAIMDQGRIVEAGPAIEVIAEPRSETGQALVAAMPKLARRESTP